MRSPSGFPGKSSKELDRGQTVMLLDVTDHATGQIPEEFPGRYARLTTKAIANWRLEIGN